MEHEVMSIPCVKSVSMAQTLTAKSCTPCIKRAEQINNYKRVFLIDDIVVIDDVHYMYNVDTIDTLQAELNPRRFSGRGNNTHLLVCGIHSEFQ